MATTLSALLTIARNALIEPTAKLWSDAELISIANLGIKDLWRGINELRQKHFCTLDVTNVSQVASATSLSGVPSNLIRVHMLEPRDLTASSGSLIYTPLPYEHPLFQSARSAQAFDPTSGGVVYWDQIAAGGPVAAPTVVVAPALSSTVNLSLMYVPTLALIGSSDSNPIPGESDNAVVAWIIAYARAKEREDRAPDPRWIEVYATEKRNLILSLDERQVQDRETVDALFEAYWT
jgi:hypothetical protein